WLNALDGSDIRAGRRPDASQADHLRLRFRHLIRIDFLAEAHIQDGDTGFCRRVSQIAVDNLLAVRRPGDASHAWNCFDQLFGGYIPDMQYRAVHRVIGQRGSSDIVSSRLPGKALKEVRSRLLEDHLARCHTPDVKLIDGPVPLPGARSD